jgi:hypothetical protein
MRPADRTFDTETDAKVWLTMTETELLRGEWIDPDAGRVPLGDVDAGLLDELMAKIDAGGVQLTGEGGFLPEMIKAVLERGLAAELTEHLGYEKGDPAGRGSPNSRNGTTPKTLATEVGDVALATPRDRAGTFEPRLVPKGARRAGGLDDMIISLYAGGMTVRDIQHHLARTIGTDLSHETISKVTNAVAEEVKAWQARPLEELYPIVYLDALVVKVRDGHQVRNKAAHIAVGVGAIASTPTSRITPSTSTWPMSPSTPSSTASRCAAASPLTTADSPALVTAAPDRPRRTRPQARAPRRPRHHTQRPNRHHARQLRPPGCVDPWRSPDPATDARDDETATRPSNATATKLATRIGSLSSVPFREDGGDEADSESPPHLLRQLRTFLVAERAGPADLVDRSALVRGGTASQIVGQLVCV